MKEIQELSQFNKACDEFASGKYILVDMKISSILRIVEEDEKIKDIINACLENYIFNNKLQEYSNFNGEKYYLVMPKSEQEIIAFVYILMSRFKRGDIDFYEFLTTYFNAENVNGQEFNNFASSIILPFKSALNNMYSKRHVLVETNDYQMNIYNKIKTTIKLIVDNVDNYKLGMTQKEEFTMLLNSLYLASEKNDKKLVFSLMIGLDYFTKAYKKTRAAYLALEDCFEST